MHKYLVFLIFTLAGSSSGLYCWECHNARSNKECLQNGRAVMCSEKNAVCEDHVRHDQNGKNLIIEKRCKQSHACANNVAQNIRKAFPIQCNLQSPTSICRCCCSGNLCNRELLSCWRDIPQFKSPLDQDIGKCQSRPISPLNANMQCTGNMESGTFCDFKCHDGYHIKGRKRITCIKDLLWDYPVPECEIVRCLVGRISLPNGRVTCTDGTKLRSRCTFSCNANYALVGHRYTNCIDIGRKNGRGLWNWPTPYCKSLLCPRQDSLTHGRMSCTRGIHLGSRCSFRCNSGYLLYPEFITSNVCQEDGTWNLPMPCCSVRCPPNVLMDFIVILDSSSSVGIENWIRMKKFVRSFLDDFTVSSFAANYAVIRYNRHVDSSTQILLNDYPNDIKGLLRAFDNIPYDGSGTYTGNALNYTTDFLMKVGNRRKAKDIVLLITDGFSQDKVRLEGQRLREAGALLYVLPVLPPRGRLSMNQIYQIAGPGNEDFVLKEALEGGFDALDETFAKQMSELLCTHRCGL